MGIIRAAAYKLRTARGRMKRTLARPVPHSAAPAARRGEGRSKSPGLGGFATTNQAKKSCSPAKLPSLALHQRPISGSMLHLPTGGEGSPPAARPRISPNVLVLCYSLTSPS